MDNRMQGVSFGNPRLFAEFNDWPSGKDRVNCKFEVEHKDGKGYRVVRTTTKNGQWCKPKAHTYSGRAAIVDGSDGKTYILQVAQGYGFIKVSRHDFMDAREGVFERNEPELHATLLAIINQLYPPLS